MESWEKRYRKRMLAVLSPLIIALFPNFTGIPLYFTERIRGEFQLERMLDEEARKLGLDSDEILVIQECNVSSSTSYARRLSSGKYEICLNSSNPLDFSQETRGVLRHELFHIAGRGSEDDENLLEIIVNDYLEEIKANVYASTGIRL